MALSRTEQRSSKRRCSENKQNTSEEELPTFILKKQLAIGLQPSKAGNSDLTRYGLVNLTQKKT